MVATLRQLLNLALVPSPELPAGHIFDSATQNAVMQFQLAHNLPANGRVGPSTWGALGAEVGAHNFPMQLLGALPSWLRGIISGKESANGFNASIFLSMYMSEWGGLSSNATGGLESLLLAIAMDSNVSDIRWAAYMLATVKHECANRWRPIEEFGKGAGHAYGKPVVVKDRFGASYTNVYYGRGYVQLTWKDNYSKMGQALGMDDALLIHPERALDPGVAYNVMSYGMRSGSFTSTSLSDYITGDRCDYKHARKIINGLDQWALIQSYAYAFEAMLKASASS
jgi:hypothetical protein